ncbi:MAG: hypothetical protein ABIH42_02390 [Planctomycetota bacterium]
MPFNQEENKKFRRIVPPQRGASRIPPARQDSGQPPGQTKPRSAQSEVRELVTSRNPQTDSRIYGRPPGVQGTVRKAPSGLTEEQIHIGRVLVAEGPITAEYVDNQIESAGMKESLLARAVVASGHCREDRLVTILLSGYKIPKVKLGSYKIPEQIVNVLPPDVARRCKMIPIGRIGNILCVAAGSIFQIDIEAISEVRTVTGCMLKIFQSSAEEVEEALEILYPEEPDRERVEAESIQSSELEKIKFLRVPYEDTSEYWEKTYASNGPIKAIEF